jgi:hypothetical protein
MIAAIAMPIVSLSYTPVQRHDQDGTHAAGHKYGFGIEA